MSLLELLVFCVSFYISFAGSPSYIPISSVINESSLQSNISSGPWSYDTVDTRPPCITCYVLFTTNANTTRKCNPNHKFIYELWYNISGVQRGGYCIEFESLDIKKINPQITSVSATSIPTSSTGGGSTTIYQWNKGQEMTVKTGEFPDCVLCYDFLHKFPKLSPFECNPGNAMKVKVTYEIFTGMEETGYCAGQITMSERELRNIQKLFWFNKIEESKCAECYEVLALGVNASKESCDNGDNSIWHVQYYEQNWNLALDGYCVNNMMSTINFWSIMDDILFAHIYRLDLSEYHHWMSNDASEIEKTTCKPCAKIIYEHENMVEECKSNGQSLWQVWFNTTNGESYAGYCTDFLKIDLGLIADSYITYILASNESSSYEWFRAESELKQVTEIYPPCVNCSDLVNEGVYMSSFYCNPGNQTKVKVDFTTTTNEHIRGYCARFHYNYNIGKTQYSPTRVEMYDIFNTYSWPVGNEVIPSVPLTNRCINCYDAFVYGLNLSSHDCDSGNGILWQAYYEKQQFYISFDSEFVSYGYCVNFYSDSFYNWNLSEDLYYAYAYSYYYGYYSWISEDCVSCFYALVYGTSLSSEKCISGGEQRWNISYKLSNSEYIYQGYCTGLYPDSLDSWYIYRYIDYIQAENGTETYSWNRPLPSPMECVSCYDAIVDQYSLSSENCYGSEQRWHITTYYLYSWDVVDGYCINLSSDSFKNWYINDNIAYIVATDGIEYYYHQNPTFSSSSDSSSNTQDSIYCLTCSETLLYRASSIENCYPDGRIKWDVWFNSTDAFTDGSFCVDFLETDLSSIGDSITYIRASNGSLTVEWFKSEPEIKELKTTFPLCVSCYDIAYSNITFSSFDCDPNNSLKVRARFTNSLGEEDMGYCVGVGYYDFSSKNITNVTLYDRYYIYYMPDSQNAT